jgi:hypothetical protein
MIVTRARRDVQERTPSIGGRVAAASVIITQAEGCPTLSVSAQAPFIA